MESKPTPATRFATFYYFLAAIGLCAGGVGWLLITLGVKENQGILVYIWLVVSLGAMCPSMAMLLWWLRQAIREKERAEQSSAKLQRQLVETVPIRYVGISYDDLAIHLLDECYQNVKLLTVELKNEHGPNYLKAKDRHLATLRVLSRLCRDRYEKDKRLLQRGLNDESGVLQKYISLKEKLFELCDQLDHTLSAKTNDRDQAKVAIEIVGGRLGEFVRSLDNAISLLTSESARPQA